MIQELIDRALLKEQEERGKRERSGKISPSSLGYCYRKQYWNRKGETPSNPPEIRSLRVFKAGKLFHDYIQQFIPDAQKEVLCETDDIKGYADIVTPNSIIDIKSTHSRQFWYIEKSQYDIAREKKHNWLQVACYGWILKKPTVSLYLVSKDDLCSAEYFFPTEKFLPDLQHELDLLRDAWERKELPKGEPRVFGVDKKTKNAKECERYCNYRDLCIKTGGGYVPH